MTITNDPVAAAEEEAAEAASLAKSLEERIREGDESVNAEDLAQAESLGRFAWLRVEAAKRKVTAARRQDVLATAKTLVEDLDDFVDVDKKLAQAWRTAVLSLRKLEVAADERVRLVEQAVSRIGDVDDQVRLHAEQSLDQLGVLPARFGGEMGFQLPARDLTIENAPTGRVVAAAVHEALSSNTLHGMSQQSAEPDLAGSTFASKVYGWPDMIRRTRADVEKLG